MPTEETHYTQYLGELKSVIDQLPLAKLKHLADILFHTYENDRTIVLFGNGGSAALASHLATDLAKGTHFPGPSSMKNVRRMRVLALTDNTPLITAWSNDLDYEQVFAGQLENFVRARDVAFGISGSGNSPSVLRALELARRSGATTVGFAGFGGGKMKELLDCAVVVDSENMQQVEDAHVILSHLLFLDLKARIEATAASVATKS
ncbi:MAG: SIS domain-containing protein [Acidobacteria bacterium]|nr:SIS domain-containing protein [Acidobacteriota bacterium]